MISKATARYIRISPRKTRLVTRLLRDKSVTDAYGILLTVNKRACRYVDQLLKSAVSNAKQKSPGINESDLYISKIMVDGGPSLKRFQAASMGRAGMIRKRTAHISMELSERVKRGTETTAGKTETVKAKKKKTAVAAKKTAAKKTPVKTAGLKKAAAKA